MMDNGCCHHGGPVSRRQMLGGATALGLAGWSAASFAADKPAAPGAPYRVDVHHHYFEQRFIRETRERFERETVGLQKAEQAQRWTIQNSIDAMDAAGVATSMLSLNQPGPLIDGNVEGTRALTRHCNDFAARAQSDHPGRFGHFASLPLPDVEGSLKEIEYALDTLKADGFICHTSESDIWLGDRRFWPVYEELDRRGAVLFVHPATPGCCQQVPTESPPAILEFPFDTARAITNLIYSGAARRFPRIRFIFSHGGGALPMLLDRLEMPAHARPELAENVPEGAYKELLRFYFDTAQMYNPTAFAALQTMVPKSHILFGTDVPFANLGACVEKLGKFVPDQAVRRAIERDNAVAIMPQLDEALRRIAAS